MVDRTCHKRPDEPSALLKIEPCPQVKNTTQQQMIQLSIHISIETVPIPSPGWSVSPRITLSWRNWMKRPSTGYEQPLERSPFPTVLSEEASLGSGGSLVAVPHVAPTMQRSTPPAIAPSSDRCDSRSHHWRSRWPMIPASYYSNRLPRSRPPREKEISFLSLATVTSARVTIDRSIITTIRCAPPAPN